MSLAGKYLKYSPEITLEIFTLVWNKLKLIFPNGKIYDWVKVWDFDAFKERGYISIWGDNKYCFGINCCPGLGNYTEVTVQEILGYDPFVNKEIIPEYVECIGLSESKVQGWSNHYTIGNIYKLNSKPDYNFTYIVGDDNEEWACDFSQFKPSTKEAFDAQNQPKSIEKWSIGSYVVFLNSEIQSNGFNKGDIQQIREYNLLSIIYYSGVGNTVSDKGISEQIKWFAIKSEAEEFAKTLVEPVKKKVKQPLKQAVHCKTQEEWDFVTEKLGYKWSKYSEWSSYKNNTCIGLNKLGFGTAGVAYKGYQILSFQEWCDLNGYKMENKCEFKVGDWVYFIGSEEYLTTRIWVPGKVCKIQSIKNDSLRFKESNGDTSANRIDQFRHATSEEINQHLISIGQILAGEPLNTGIEPNKDGMFKYKQTMPGASWSGGTIDNHLDVMIQSKTQSEIEFNYLPEPK